jgi:hypothetical protein
VLEKPLTIGRMKFQLADPVAFDTGLGTPFVWGDHRRNLQVSVTVAQWACSSHRLLSAFPVPSTQVGSSGHGGHRYGRSFHQEIGNHNQQIAQGSLLEKTHEVSCHDDLSIW